MKRKPWGGLLLALALTVCLSLLPTTAQAAEEHKHVLCGMECSGHGGGESKHVTEITWKPISTWKELEAAGKNGQDGQDDKQHYYYLANDLTGTYQWQPTANVTLCLNGHSLTMDGDYPTIYMVNSGSLTLTDCNGDNGSYRFRKDSTTSKWELVIDGTSYGDDITVTGGVITHAKDKTKNSGVCQ